MRRFLCSLTFLAALLASAAPMPVIYCTDLFHPHEDPDDHFDLATLFAMPDLEVKLIVLDQGERQRQSPGRIPVSQMNQLTGRKVPAVSGLARPLKAPADPARDQPAQFQQGVESIVQVLRESRTPVSLAAVGSVRDVTAAFNREPALFRAKVARLLVFIGEASLPGFREYNVALDPQAYVGLMRSGLPVWWVPCFDGGPWQNKGHASYWKARHSDLLEKATPGLLQYFIYALEKEKADPLAFLTGPVDPSRKQELLAGERNLWCTAVFAVLAWPTNQTSTQVFGFSPVELSINDEAVITYGPGKTSQKVMRFEVRDRDRYARQMTLETAEWLAKIGRP
jgi:hypothetical protein